MKNLIKNRTILGIACIGLSLILCFALTPIYNEAISAKTDVLRISRDIEAGDLITEEMIQSVEVGNYNLPDTVLIEKTDVVGQYAAAKLFKDDMVLSSKLSVEPLAAHPYLNKFNGKDRAVSVAIRSLAAGLSGMLEQGDIVSILAYEYGESKMTISPIELKYVEVLAVTTSKGRDSAELAESTEEDESSVEKELPETVTLKASPEQAIKLVDLEANGKIHMAFVYRGAHDETQKFLEVQSKVLEMQKNEREESDQEMESKQDIEDNIEVVVGKEAK